MEYLNTLGTAAKAASAKAAIMSTADKNRALAAIAGAIVKDTDHILKYNRLDINNAQKNGLKSGMIDRLTLTKDRIAAIAESIKELIALDDPIGEILESTKRPNGLLIEKVVVPLGVIAIIYESRPNVTVDCAALCLKAGNSVVLRGGSEAFNSNKALCDIMRAALIKEGFTSDLIILVEDSSRECARELMRLNKYIDVLIPRGGQGLIRSVIENATVPTIETGSGNCHTYIDESADLEMAVELVYNAKVSRPSVCNSLESLVVNEAIAKEALPLIKERLNESGVELRGCERTCRIIDCACAEPEDFYKEYNDYIMSVKVVKDITEAIAFINEHSTKHSEAIITQNNENSNKFLTEIDSAAVYLNASTRFTDGFEFGLGAEIGISTQKLHARGPMGIKALCATKYLIKGNGQIRK